MTSSLSSWVLGLVSLAGPLASVAQIAPQPNLVLPGVPREIMLPAGHTPVFEAHAQGVQIYKCVATQGAPPAWTLSGPDARLFGSENLVIGTHFAAPSPSGSSPHWKLNDGSEVVGAKTAGVDAPDGKGVQWLLLQVISNSQKGILADVTSVQRVNTNGGKAPVSGCSKATLDETTRVPYTADYYFSK